jgi:predicted acetyltransferase
MEGITYSRATISDLQTIIDLRLIFAIEFSGPQTSESIQNFKNHNQDYIQRSIQNNSFIAYLAKIGNEIAGMGGLVIREQPGNFRNPSGKVGYLFNMYTFPKFRRKGICSELLRLLLEEAGSMGIMAFELHASEEGESVYKQNGFAKHPEPTYRKYIVLA